MSKPRGQKPVRRIFGVDAAFDGMSSRYEAAVVHCDVRNVGKLAVACDVDLPTNQVRAGHGLCDRMFYLQACVHLQEVKRTVVVDHELDGARPAIVHFLCQPDRGFGHLRAQVFAHKRRGRFLDDFLVASLHRTFAFAQMHDVPVSVAEYLYLDVTWADDVFFQEYAVVTERGRGFSLGRSNRSFEFGRFSDDTHSASAAPSRGFDQNRIAERCGGLRVGFGISVQSGRRDHREFGAHGDFARANLVAHYVDGFGCRSYEYEAGGLGGARELGILREKTVARVQGVGAGGLCRIEDACDVQIARGGRIAAQTDGGVGHANVRRVAIRVRVNRDRFEHDAARDLTAICDQESPQGYILNTPNCVSSMGRFSAADKLNATT